VLEHGDSGAYRTFRLAIGIVFRLFLLVLAAAVAGEMPFSSINAPGDGDWMREDYSGNMEKRQRRH